MTRRKESNGPMSALILESDMVADFKDQLLSTSLITPNQYV